MRVDRCRRDETRRCVDARRASLVWKRDDDGPGVLVWVCQDDYISGLLLVGGYLCMSKTAVLRLRQRFVLVSGVLFVVWITRGLSETLMDTQGEKRND